MGAGACSEPEGDKTGRAAGRTTAGEEPQAQRNVWALGLEPRTVGLENRCSIQLSYAHMFLWYSTLVTLKG